MEHGFFNNGEIVLGGHFLVCVISESRDDVDKLLAPYQENNMGTCPKEYLAFVNAETEFEKDEISREYTSFYDFANDRGYQFDEKQNAYGSWENPNAKWDWYKIGGEFDGRIPLIGGGGSSCCRIREADISQKNDFYLRAMQFWNYNIASDGLLDDSKRELFLKCHGNGDNFAESRYRFFTGAFVAPDGKWHQIGDNGTIQKDASSSGVQDYYSLFYKTLQEAPPDYWITVVDCHI